MRVGVSEGACYLEGDEAGNGGRIALKGRKGGKKGIGDGRKNTGGKKSTQGEKNRQRRADSLVEGKVDRYSKRGRNGAIDGRRRA